jgi:hypothetical protein
VGTRINGIPNCGNIFLNNFFGKFIELSCIQIIYKQILTNIYRQ